MPPIALRLRVHQWLEAKTLVKDFTKREKDLNKELSAVVETLGTPDDRGHLWYELPEPIDGCNVLQRQRRVTVIMDDEAAIAILEAKGILEACSTSYLRVTDPNQAIAALEAAGLLEDSGFEISTQVNDSDVSKAYFEGKITQAEYEEIFTDKISWALLPGNI